MAVKSKFEKKLKDLEEKGRIPHPISWLVLGFYTSLVRSSPAPISDELETLLLQFIDHVDQQIHQPFLFQPYHTFIPQYRDFGMNFFRPVINFEKSQIVGIKNLDRIAKQLEQGDNVIFLANHQIEGDPQMLMLLFEKPYPKLAEQIIFVAGHRVTTDPIAVPFSMGCNLLCIYSKRHIDHPPEKKRDKQLHNQKTMKVMRTLLQKGSQCIYVAPSGGRDRMDDKGHIEVADFDPQSIEMFRFIAKKSATTTHFYPLALSTYHILPPPKTIEKKLGEERNVGSGPIQACVGDEIDIENIPLHGLDDKYLQRKERARYIHDIVRNDYKRLIHENP